MTALTAIVYLTRPSSGTFSPCAIGPMKKTCNKQLIRLDVRRRAAAKVVTFAYGALLGRTPTEEELNEWINHLPFTVSARGMSKALLRFIDFIEDSSEAKDFRGYSESLSSGEIAEFIYLIIDGRGPGLRELKVMREAIEAGQPLAQLVTKAFLDAIKRRRSGPQPIDTTRCHVHGAVQVLTLADWEMRSEEIGPVAATSRLRTAQARSIPWYEQANGQPSVSIITSIFKGSKYIEFFLKNILSQSIFKTHCELIIIDANSPDDEYSFISKYLDAYPNIVYHRCANRVGIYEAWNTAVQMSRGRYCTNANLDDMRRIDSLELQFSMLEKCPFADVVYQDVYYSLEENLEFEAVESRGFKTSFPMISRYNLMEFNAPHNAPMWRKQLHLDVGLFDEKLKSAGDWDFWLRCSCAGKVFLKSHEAHVGYYVNPSGMSTQPFSPAVAEIERLSAHFFPRMISNNLKMDTSAFFEVLRAIEPDARPGGDRYSSVQNALRTLSKRMRTPADEAPTA